MFFYTGITRCVYLQVDTDAEPRRSDRGQLSLFVGCQRYEQKL